MICTEGCHPVTFIFCCKTLSHHLIISTEGSVFFLHGCHKVFCCQTTCITWHNLWTWSTCRTCIRTCLGIIHNKFDLFRSDSCLTKCFMWWYKNPHISALSVIFPCSIHCNCSIRIQLCKCVWCINTIKTTAIYTERYTDTIFDLAIRSCILFSHTFLSCFIQWTSCLEQFFFTVYFRRITCRDRTAFWFFVTVHFTDIEGVDSHLCSQNIYRNLRSHIRLRRSVSTECWTPCMVCKHCCRFVTDRIDSIACTCKLGKSHCKQITEFWVWTMIHIVIAPECKKLTIFICCKLDIHKCRGSLSCISNILELIKYQRHRTFKDLNSSADQSLICRRELVTKGSSCMVLNNS